jgi:hypothetical protein
MKKAEISVFFLFIKGMVKMYGIKNKGFIKAYNSICYRHDRLQVFYDFVKMCAISIYNAFSKNEEMEQEYLRTIKSYSKEEQNLFPKMFGELIMMYEETEEITDILGSIYMNTKSKDKSLGQVFTPTNVSDFMAKVLIENTDTLKHNIEKNGFITMCEPTCGAGGMILSLAKAMKNRGINYQQDLLVEAIDIADICTYMTYIQLSLYGIPAIVYCENSLTQEMQFKMETPLFFLQYWKFRKFYMKPNEEELEQNNKKIIIERPTEKQIILKETTVKGNCQISLW